ncbi:MAG: DNRLRE domain-containing protein [Acidobacteriota bacterium]
MLSRSSICLAIAFSLLVPASAFAGDTVVEIPAARDNSLYEDDTGALSNGAGDYLFTGRTAPQNNELLRRAVLAFDVADVLPLGATIVSVELELTMSMSIVGETDVTIHRLTADWGEGTSDAAGQEGGGGPSTTGDATWIHTFFDTAQWTTPGGDFVAVASASAPVAGNGQYTWGSTAQMVADVQAWVDNPASDYGWIVIGDEQLPAPTAKRFNSSENGEATERPLLRVTFNTDNVIFTDDFESGDTTAWTATIQP